MFKAAKCVSLKLPQTQTCIVPHLEFCILLEKSHTILRLWSPLRVLVTNKHTTVLLISPPSPNIINMEKASKAPWLDRFNRDPYQDWKVEIKCLLMIEGLWEFVSGENLPEDADDATKEEFRRKQQAACGFIWLHRYKKNINLPEHLNTTPAQMFAKFDSMYGPNQFALCRRLAQCKMEEGVDLMDFTYDLLDILSQLSDAGWTWPEDHVVDYLLGSLPASYERLHNIIVWVCDRPLSLDKVVESFQRYEMARKEKEELERRNRAQGRRRRRNNNNNNNENNNNKSSRQGVDSSSSCCCCGYCGKMGHGANVCRKRLADERRRGQANLRPQATPVYYL